MTKYMTSEGLEATIRATAGEAQLKRYEDLKTQGWDRADIRQSPCRRYIAIGMTRNSTSGYQGGYLCSDGKFALPPKGQTGVRLTATCTRAF